MEHPEHAIDFRLLAHIVSPRQLMEFTGLSAATIWRMRKRGDLPNPIQLSPGRVGWRSEQIHTWLNARAGTKG